MDSEHFGKIFVLFVVIAFMVVVAVAQPEPIPSITRQIQISLRMYDWGYTLVDEQGNEIYEDYLWKGLLSNQTNIQKIGVRNTGTIPIFLEVGFSGAEEILHDYENGTVTTMWIIPNAQEDRFRVWHSYTNQTIEPEQTFYITFYIIATGKWEETYNVTLEIEAMEVKE